MKMSPFGFHHSIFLFALGITTARSGFASDQSTTGGDSLQFMRNLPCTPNCTVDQLTAAGADQSGRAAAGAQDDANRLQNSAAARAGLSDQIGRDIPLLRNSLAQIDQRSAGDTAKAQQDRDSFLARSLSKTTYGELAQSYGLSTNKDLLDRGGEVRRRLDEEAGQLAEQGKEKMAAAKRAFSGVEKLHSIGDVALARVANMESAAKESKLLKSNPSSEESAGKTISSEKLVISSSSSLSKPTENLVAQGSAPKTPLRGELKKVLAKAASETGGKEATLEKKKPRAIDDSADQAKATAELEQLIALHSKSNGDKNLGASSLDGAKNGSPDSDKQNTPEEGQHGEILGHGSGTAGEARIQASKGATSSIDITLFQRVSARLKQLQREGNISLGSRD